MRRREFITLLGGAAVPPVLWPLTARAQQPTRPVVGILRSTSPDETTTFLGVFSEGLREAGYIDGQNAIVDLQLAGNAYDRLPALAANFASRKVAVIVAAGAVNAALAAKAATTTIPIVFIIGSDPVQHGLVKSLGRPGGNITGVTFFGSAVMAKRVELLRELIPQAAAIGFLVNPDNPNAVLEAKELEAIATNAGFALHVVAAGGSSGLNNAFETLAQLRVDAFLHSTDVSFTSRYPALIELAKSHKLPGIYGRRDVAVAGGLVSYGARTADVYRVAGIYTGRILKGEKPSDLPVQLPTTFELYLNMKTARELGITVPTSILLRADEVIE